MIIKKNVLASVFIFVLGLVVSSSVLFPNKAFADIISGDYTYTLNGDNTANITDYIGLSTDVTIPSSLDGYTVSSIASSSFDSTNNITSLIIPDTVTFIESNSFYNISTLTSLTIGSGLTTINSNLFSGSSLTNLVIPDTVTTINNGAFGDLFQIV